MEGGDPDEVGVLVSALSLRPDSLYRATLFTAAPPEAGGEGRAQLGWLGWDQQVALLLDIRNLLAPKQRLSGPPMGDPGSPATEIQVLQRQRLRTR